MYMEYMETDVRTWSSLFSYFCLNDNVLFYKCSSTTVDYLHVDRAVMLELHEHNNSDDLLQPIKLTMTSEGDRLYEPRYIIRTK